MMIDGYDYPDDLTEREVRQCLRHESRCPFRVTLLGPFLFTCTHGRELCAECDACTCKDDGLRAITNEDLARINAR